MPTDGGNSTEHAASIDAAVRAALADLPDAALAADDTVDRGSLALGLRLGLERPDQARDLLDRIRTGTTEPSVGLAVDDVPDAPESPRSIPVASSLLARAAALPPSEWATVGPEVVYGWVGRLAPAEILHIGRVVTEMLASGSSPDVGRGFGLAWTDGVRVPRPELEVMLHEFTELEITVGSILTGSELRTGMPAPRQGLASWLGDWLPRTRPGESQAADAIERTGEPGRRGLVALWNVWMAMRYRALMPAPTFELLVGPWVTVIGPLPDA